MAWLDLLFDPEFLLGGLAAIAAFATIISIAMPFFQKDKLKSRMHAVAQRKEELKNRQREELNNRVKSTGIRTNSRGLVKKAVEDLNLRDRLENHQTKMKLAQAGLRGQKPLFTYLFFRLVTPIVALLATLVYMFFIDKHGYDPLVKIAIALGGGAVGFYAPNVFLQNMIAKRQDKISIAFPDALDLLLICVESGMSIEAAFSKVTEEIAAQSIELAEEMGLTTAELSYLGDRRIAFENLAARVGLPGVKAVSTALSQAERYGTPLGTALRVMAQENRDERMTKAEQKAASLPAKLTVPMIVFFLPVLFVVVLGPAILKVMAL